MKRLTFIPSERSREYFDSLIKRLKAESRLPVRVTQRAAFDVMTKYAQVGDPAVSREYTEALLGRRAVK